MVGTFEMHHIVFILILIEFLSQVTTPFFE